MESNWKNVNNWHWTEKNCLKFSQLQLSDSLSLLSTSTYKVFDIKVSGGCDLNHRKGKLFVLFDLEITFSLAYKTKSQTSLKVSVSEISQDLDFESWEVKVVGTEVELNTYLNTTVLPELKKIVSGLEAKVIEGNKADVKVSSKPTVVPNTTKVKRAAVEGSGEKLQLEFSFDIPQPDLYRLLTDAKLISTWSKQPTSFVAAPNLSFRTFNNTIKGTIIQVDKQKLLKMKWRFEAMPKDVYSDVTLTFDTDTTTEQSTLTVHHENIPKEFLNTVELHWHKEIYQNLKDTFDQPKSKGVFNWVQKPIPLVLTTTVLVGLTYISWSYFQK